MVGLDCGGWIVSGVEGTESGGMVRTATHRSTDSTQAKYNLPSGVSRMARCFSGR
jgi:hypothetical protein